MVLDSSKVKIFHINKEIYCTAELQLRAPINDNVIKHKLHTMERIIIAKIVSNCSLTL